MFVRLLSSLSVLPLIYACSRDPELETPQLTVTQQTAPPHNPTIQAVGKRLVAGEINFGEATSPNTPYSVRQMCNKLWYDSARVAGQHCSAQVQTIRIKHKFPTVDKKYSYLDIYDRIKTSDGFARYLQECIDEARKKTPMDPFQNDGKWAMIPDEVAITILPPGPNSFAFQMKKSVGGGVQFNISESGITTLNLILPMGEVAKGKAYLIAVLAHEFFHISNKLQGLNSILDDTTEEIEGHKLTIRLLEESLAHVDEKERFKIAKEIEKEKPYLQFVAETDQREKMKIAIKSKLEVYDQFLDFLYANNAPEEITKKYELEKASFQKKYDEL